MIARTALRRLAGLLPALALGVAALTTTSAPADAANLRLGHDREVRQIQDVKVKGPNGEALFLGHRVNFLWVGLPVRVSDEGYVLGIKGSDRNFTLDKILMAKLQAEGKLPTPLPDYALTTGDHVMGNLMWIVLGLVALWQAIRNGLKLTRLVKLPRLPLPSLQLPQLSTANVAARARSGMGRVTALVGNLPKPQLVRAAKSAANAYAADIFAPVAAEAKAGQLVATKAQVAQPVAQQASKPATPAAVTPSNVVPIQVAKVVCRVKSLKAA